MKPDAVNEKMDALLRIRGFGDVLEAAIAGDVDAQCYLGMVWGHGGECDGGRNLPVSLDQALRWYSVAAESAYDGLRDVAIRHRDRLFKMIQGETWCSRL